MEKSQINIIISMIIQSLRRSNHNEIIDLIKKSDYDVEWRYSDGCFPEHNYYELVIYITYDDYYNIFEKRNLYIDIIHAALDSFYFNEYEIIEKVTILTKLNQFVDWDGLDVTENKSSVLERINQEKNMLIDVGTGELDIKYANEEYIRIHKELCNILNKICLSNPNNYNDLWEWYEDYKKRPLPTYTSRRKYINNLYESIINTIDNSSEKRYYLTEYIPTGWEKVDKCISKMKSNLIKSTIKEDFQSIGHYGREVLITIAQNVFDKEKHKSPDGTDIGNADSKRMLEAYINYKFKGKKGDREKKFVKSAIDFANEITHRSTLNKIDAELCYNAIVSTSNIIRIIDKEE